MKKKILLLSDHALSTSGVGTQSRHLVEGLVKKGTWTFRQLGAAIKHENYETICVNPDFIIKPIDGFGNRDMIRLILAQEKPDAIMLFTDPRFFIWLFEMEDEIHQICPIVWWHVWDNRPTPTFNDPLYEATDLINCHSHLTYEMVSERFPEKTNFVPHAIPQDIFYPLTDVERTSFKKQILGSDRENSFVCFWVSRNAKRKRTNDVLESWSIFYKHVKERDGKCDAILLMHTDPYDIEGPNLIVTAEKLGILNSVIFSRDRIGFDKMNVLFNISDVCLNISFAEGFGLGTLEAMQAGLPIIAVKTGGLTRQVVDHRDGSENGIALPVEMRSLVGSQQVPYIYEDYVSCETVSKAITKIHDMDPADRRKLGAKAREYSLSEFSYQNTIDTWDRTLSDVVENWKERYTPWKCEEI